MNDEKIAIEFNGEEFNRITEYMKLVEATSIQNAIMNAISIAMDDNDYFCADGLNRFR